MSLVKETYSLTIISPRGSAYTNVEDIADDVKHGRVHASLSQDDEEGVANAWLIVIRDLAVSDSGDVTFGAVPTEWLETAFRDRGEAENAACLLRVTHARRALGYWTLIVKHGFKDRVFGEWGEEDTRRLYRALYSVKEPELLRDVEAAINQWKGHPKSVYEKEIEWLVSKMPILNLVALKEITFK